MTNAKRKQKTVQSTKSSSSKKLHLAPAPLDKPATKPETLSSTLGNAPLYKEHLGRVHLAIWAREDKSGTVRFSVKLSRSYKTESGFRDTSSLDAGDLANAIALLTHAQSVIPPMAVLEPQS